MSRIVLPYGRGKLTARWPGSLEVLRPEGLGRPRSGNEELALVRKALRSPVGSPSLAECARGATSAVVIISDHTRRTALRRLLPPVFAELASAGTRPDAVTLLVAYGGHPRATDREVRRLTGRLPRGVRIAHHDASSPVDLAPVVCLGSGEPVRLNRLAVDMLDYRPVETDTRGQAVVERLLKQIRFDRILQRMRLDPVRHTGSFR